MAGKTGGRLTHIDESGSATMVDVTGKAVSERVATARGYVEMSSETLALIREGGVKKGDVLSVARLAGIMGAKRTADLIPLCHPLSLTGIEVDLSAEDDPPRVEIAASCRLAGRTGVEMEALTAVSVAALTIYDMCKAADRSMRISNIRLVHKSGGKSGRFDAE